MKLSTEVLETLKLLEKLFSNGISNEWLKALAFGDTTIYGEGYGVITVLNYDGKIIVNSGTIGRGRFTFGMLKDMRNILINSDIIAFSYYGKPIVWAKKLGLKYDNKLNIYYKGDTKWLQQQQ